MSPSLTLRSPNHLLQNSNLRESWLSILSPQEKVASLITPKDSLHSTLYLGTGTPLNLPTFNDAEVEIKIPKIQVENYSISDEKSNIINTNGKDDENLQSTLPKMEEKTKRWVLT